MALPRTAEARMFYQAANQRFDDARFLLEKDRTTGAIYLAGYAVECILKALILAAIAESNARKKAADSFRGSKAHDFEWLKSVYLDNGGPSFPPKVVKWFTRVNSWSTELRYKPGTVKQREADEMINAAEQILEWGDGRL